jgi:dolichol-phosphate mannosyltransferase
MKGADPPSGPVQLSIVLATLNEGSNLPQVVDRIRRLPLPAYEIVVVDDGSTDGTREYLVRESSHDPRVRYLFHDGKQTTLRAHAQGIEAAAGPFVVIMDADLQHSPETIPSLLDQLDRGAVLSIASRYVAGGSAGPRPLGRAISSKGAEWIAHRCIRASKGVKDPVSGYFAFRRSIWRPIPPEYRGFKILLFVLVMADGGHVAEAPYHFENRAGGSSKVEASAYRRMYLREVRWARRFERERPAARSRTGA